VTKLYHRINSFVHRAWQDFLNVMFDPYRPELHYMRGAGPKWHAKYQGAIAAH
jgi:hypothetical protein